MTGGGWGSSECQMWNMPHKAANGKAQSGQYFNQYCFEFFSNQQKKTVLLFMHIQYAITRAGKTGSCWLCHSSNLLKNYQKQNSELFSPVKSISFLFVLTFCSKIFYLFNDYYAKLMPNHMTMDHFDQIVFSERQLSSAVSWRFCENESGTSKILYFYFLSQRKFVFNRVLPSI